MAKIELPPTKSSLRKIKEDLAFAYEGHDLLNQKREILATEIVSEAGRDPKDRERISRMCSMSSMRPIGMRLSTWGPRPSP